MPLSARSDKRPKLPEDGGAKHCVRRSKSVQYRDEHQAGERSADYLVPDGAKDNLWGSSGKDARYLHRLKECLSRMRDEQREFLLFTLKVMVRKK